jgi:(p)ppGpp synthase/HD superfamily hydrolase
MPGEVDRLVGALELKEMDGVLLAADIRARAASAGIPSARLDEAIALAAWAHRGQRRLRRGDLPKTAYIEHPLRNASRVLRWGVVSEPIVLACILHDTVEDHAGEIAAALGREAVDEHGAREAVLADYDRRFGARTGELVRAMSNPIGDDVDAGETAKHETYRHHVLTEIADPEVAICKLADLADNALSLHHTGEGDARTARLARKYAPLLPAFAARLGDHDVRGLLDAGAVDDLRRALADGAERLRLLGSSASGTARPERA